MYACFLKGIDDGEMYGYTSTPVLDEFAYKSLLRRLRKNLKKILLER